jgi:aldehyde:ferredoxin oxidoreductase
MSKDGYAGEILKVDLSSHEVSRMVTADYAGRFLGGKGLAARLYWDNVPPHAKALDPENCLICATGPVAGFPGFTASRWLVCGKTAATEPETFSYGNLGGSWGIRLKYAGYDAIIVQGKADKPAYIFIHDGAVEIKDASNLWGASAFEAEDRLKEELGGGVSVLTIGPAAENLVAFATVLADEGSSGSGGLGVIMGSKKLKAIAVAGDRRPAAADPEGLRELAARVRELTKSPVPQMWWMIPGRTRARACYGCGIGCFRHSYTDEDGRRYKSMCQPIDIYRRPASKYYDGWNDVILLAMRLCDGYGLDSSVMQAMIEWLIRCYKEGLLSDETTGLPLSAIGGPDFIETITRKIALREGFGDILARGTVEAANAIGGRARELISYSVMNRTNEVKDYDPRLIVHNALLLALEPRRSMQSIHEASGVLMGWLAWLDGGEGYVSPDVVRQISARYWGSEAAADYTSYEGKALMAKKTQDRTSALESLVLCNARWPMLHNPLTDDHLGVPDLPARILSAVTGRKTDLAELELTGERIFNLQRAVLLRDGWGGRDGDRLLDYHHEEPLQYSRFDRECKVPGKNGAVGSRKGTVVDRREFERMKDEFYQWRGWDAATGLPTGEKFRELQLEDVAGDLSTRGLLK